MLGTALTYSRTGMKCEAVTVEADVKRGLPAVVFTGMLSQEVREARERIRPALQNSGYDFPAKKITVHFSPADAYKSGTHYDLAIAVAILKAQKQLHVEDEAAFFGELTLSGDVKGVRGILALVNEAKAVGIRKIYVPLENMNELAKFEQNILIPVNSLSGLKKPEVYTTIEYAAEEKKDIPLNVDFSDVQGQDEIIEGMIIAGAGNHHILMVGPPGTGKTMCAGRLPGIMPELSEDELMEINMIYSIASEISGRKWVTERPFRSPHNSSSTRAVIGGGPKLLPGEVSLAHKGVLFLDEFLEFHNDALQALRTIMETKEVHLSLRNGYSVYPADFLLVAAANPCPCGNYHNPGSFCSCSETQVAHYRRKLNSPLTDRIDIQLKTGRISYHDLSFAYNSTHSSDTCRELIIETRKLQKERYKNEEFSLNGMIPPQAIRKYCKMTSPTERYFEHFTESKLLSARSVHKILRVARTIADIKMCELIDEGTILDAILLRFLDTERSVRNE